MVEEMSSTNVLTKTYKMRSLGEDGLNTVVSIPRIVLQREANKREISITDFLKDYRAVAILDNTDGINYKFEKVGKAK